MPFFQKKADTRVILVLIVALFLAVVAVGWALRAGRLRASTEPTPATGSPAATPSTPAPARP